MSFRNTESFYSAMLKVTNQNHLGALQAELVNKIQEKIPEVELVNPYAFSEEQRQFLLDKGIQSSYFALETHVHGLHKVIENHLLFDCIPHKLRLSSTHFAFMKASKFKALCDHKPHLAHRWNLDNVQVTPEDLTRYPDAPLGTPIINTTKQSMFLHDALHFYNPAQVAQLFEQSPSLQQLVGTIVVPVETTLEAPSFYPKFYQLRYVQDKLIYIPEHDHAGAYEQPLEAKWWLVTNKLSYENHRGEIIKLQIVKHESVYAHHVVSVQRVKDWKPTKEYVTYDSPRLSTIPNIFPNFPTFRRLIPYKLRKTLFAYAKSVKNNAELNLEAKLRSICSDEKYDIPEDTLMLLVKFTYELIELRRQVVLQHYVKESNPIYRFLRQTFGSIQNWSEAAYLERLCALMDIQEYHQIFKLEHIHLTQPEMRRGNYWPNYTYALDSIAGNMRLVHDNQVDEDGNVEVFYDFDEKAVQVDTFAPTNIQPHTINTRTTPASWLSPARKGNDCGLRAFATQFSPVDVEAAYQSVRLQIKRKIGTRDKREGYTNFQNTKANIFPWLSGGELCHIGTALGISTAIHTPLACHTSDLEQFHIYHSNNNHWVPLGPEHSCHCQK